MTSNGPTKIRVHAEITAMEYRAIADKAEAKGFDSVGEFLADIAKTVAGVNRQDDRIIALWEIGYIDRDIAAEIGVPNRVVQDTRLKLGLKANRSNTYTRRPSGSPRRKAAL